MKSVILLALLALSASAFNLTAFGIGEAQQYGLTPEEIQQNGVPCFNALSTDFTNIAQLFETKNLATILSGFSALYTQIQTDAQTTCYAYMLNVAGYISSEVNSTTDIFTVMKQNFDLYFAEIIQQVAVEINDLIAGNEEAAGAAKGLATQILLGIVTPQTLPVPSFNYSQYVPFNQEEFSSEYFTGFFGAIGLNQTFDDSEVNSCITSLITWGQAMDVLIGNFSGYSFADKVQGISSFMEVTGESIESCEYYWQLSASLFAPLKESFEASPISFVLQVVNNVAMNFPELVQSAEIEEINILEGEYEAAGQLKGERFAQIFGFAL